MLFLLDYNIKFGRKEVQMFEFINFILLRFRSCFPRKAAFHWFVIVIIVFLIRSDMLGVTSIIQDLAILPSCYPCLIHFSCKFLKRQSSFTRMDKNASMMTYDRHFVPAGVTSRITSDSIHIYVRIFSFYGKTRTKSP